MDEEQFEEQYTEEQVEPEESRAEQIAGSLGSLLGGAARGVGSAARGVVGGISSATAPRATAGVQFYPPSQFQPVEAEDGLADLFEVPQPEDNDINCDDLLELDEEEGVEDLLTVSREDILYGADKPKPKPQFIRTSRPYYPGLTGLR